MTFTTLLVANRGEIACRVLRTARRLGYRTVAVYSSADAGAPHVTLADRAVCIGPPPAGDSYLSMQALLAACQATGADALHPGYGFLSENAEFAAACQQQNIVFVGPPAQAIELMGNKSRARQLMTQAGVPCVPGYNGADQDDDTLCREAQRIGYPVMVKAAAGGGGRGMRLVHQASALQEALTSARAEAAKAFGCDQLLLEKAVLAPRHVEFQIFADQHGRVIHLGERDCSVQRRHQKVIEEAPCPVMTPGLRARMGEAAVAAARAVDYVGAGTVEFLLDDQENFYFLEMNTRLQVEHPVTELVTGQDLVAWQLDVAAGQSLPLTQDEVSLQGHAIEVRLYAEDRNFVPQTGTLLAFEPARGVDLRVDAGVTTGSVITPWYDPMLAKLISYGTSREEARRKLVSGLRNTHILGVETNRLFLSELCEHPVFAAGTATTAFIGEHFPAVQKPAPATREWAFAGLALLLAGNPQPGIFPAGWRSGSQVPAVFRLACGESTARVSLTQLRDAGDTHYRAGVAVDDKPEEICDMVLFARQGANLRIGIDGVEQTICALQHGGGLWLDAGLEVQLITNLMNTSADGDDAIGSGVLLAPMDGTVTRVVAEADTRLARGDVVLVLEAMKMEHRLLADTDGVLDALLVKAGDTVRARQKLAEIIPSDDQ